MATKHTTPRFVEITNQIRMLAMDILYLFPLVPGNGTTSTIEVCCDFKD